MPKVFAMHSIAFMWWSVPGAVHWVAVYRLDTDGDDNFDKLVKLKYLGDTAGEHGPHAIIPAPDGKHLYVIIGNQTSPNDYTHSG